MVSAMTQGQASKKGQDERIFLIVHLFLRCVGHEVKCQFVLLCLFPSSPVLNPEVAFRIWFGLVWFGIGLFDLILCISHVLISSLSHAEGILKSSLILLQFTLTDINSKFQNLKLITVPIH